MLHSSFAASSGTVGHVASFVVKSCIVLLSCRLQVLAGWIVWIGYAFAAPGIVRNKWLTKGYIEE